MEESKDRPIWFLNRGILVVRPREPFVEWVRSLDGATPPDPAVVREAVNAFLIPEFESEEESWAWIREHCSTVFEMMFHDWVVVPEMWPRDRSWETLRHWFSLERIDLAWDLVDEPLTSDPPRFDPEAPAWDA